MSRRLSRRTAPGRWPPEQNFRLRDLPAPAPVRARCRPDAVTPAISALVLVLLTADGPILVRAALRTRHGGAIEAFDFSGAMAQRAGIGWYGHVCSFSSVDAGRLRAAAPSSPGEIPSREPGRRGFSPSGVRPPLAAWNCIKSFQK